MVAMEEVIESLMLVLVIRLRSNERERMQAITY
jgi:hypothetical protein